MKEYNGHRSWNAWNVALWIGGDEGLYRYALDCIARAKRNSRRAAKYFIADLGAECTPDGAKYNQLSVRLALEGLMED